MTEDSVFLADSVSRPEEEIIVQYIQERESPIHIFGEPGVGKTTILERVITDGIADLDVNKRNIRANHSLNDLFREVCHALFAALPEDKKEEGRQFAGLSVSSPVGGAGVSFESVEAEASRAQFGYRDSLLGLSELFPEDQRLLICIDDVHELSDDERAIRDAIQEADDTLPSEVVLITAGRLAWGDLETAVSLSMFAEEQTVTFLQDVFPEISAERARTIHDQLGGHPLYIGLLAESDVDQELPDIPEREVQQEIEQRYFGFLEPDERRLLLATAPLDELNEELCTQVVSEEYGFDRITVGDILDSLSTRTVVQTIGRNADGLQTFKIHDVFREFLQERSDHIEIARRGACIYYAEKLIQLVDENRTFETEIDYVTSWSTHLSDHAINEESHLIAQLIEETVADDGLRFYPLSLLIREFKKRDATALPDEIVESVLDSVDASCSMANDFYDTDLDHSWAELLFQDGAFTNPDSNLISYLGRTTETQPTFIRRVAEEIDTDDNRTLRFLISIGRDLPIDDAALIGQQAAIWIQDDEAYGYLASHTLRLASYLAENGEYDVPLEMLEAILEPRDGDQLDIDQGMVRYNLTTMLDENFDALISERGEKLIRVFASKLTAALDQYADRARSVAARTSFADLHYVEDNRGSLEEILLEYFVRAVTAWVAETTSGNEQNELVEQLLSEPTLLRRVGFYVLSEHPESFEETIQNELTTTENYREHQSQYEFYLVLSSGFEYLDDAAQAQVCEIIEDGPYTDSVEDQAARMAERGEESASYFEQRIRETWRRDRLYMIREHLEGEYSDQLDKLVEKYGEPDQLPSRTPQPTVSGGMVRERGPVETEELREQSAEEVLTTAVEWEPPESDLWDTLEDDQLEEQNYLGFSRQLRELIMEDPQRYAREISVLEDANPRYAEAAFRAFSELVDDGETFPWESIIELGQVITASPTSWSGQVRTNLAKLINKGIAADAIEFPAGTESAVESILRTLLTDSDPDADRDQPSEGMAGYGDPVQVAINSVRPMAVNAYITYLSWQDDHTEDALSQDIFDPIRDRIREDPSLAVRSVIGRRFGRLYSLDPDLIEEHLTDIFPRDTDLDGRQRFIAAWNSYTASNRYWDDDSFRPYYRHALNLLDTDEDQAYQIAIRSTTAHVVSIYLFEDEDIADEDSLMRQFYDVVDRDGAKELASTMSSSMGNDNVEEQWKKIRELWSWRLDTLDPDDEANGAEVYQFLDCVRNSTKTTLEEENILIGRSLPFVAHQNHHWRRIEEWLAEQSTSYPVVAIDLYDELVEAVPCEDWSAIARNSEEENRSQLYESAAAAGSDPLQTALDIADQFAAENNQMDREFLEQHLTP
jgi:hypothetical protein